MTLRTFSRRAGAVQQLSIWWRCSVPGLSKQKSKWRLGSKHAVTIRTLSIRRAGAVQQPFISGRPRTRFVRAKKALNSCSRRVRSCVPACHLSEMPRIRAVGAENKMAGGMYNVHTQGDSRPFPKRAGAVHQLSICCVGDALHQGCSEQKIKWRLGCTVFTQEILSRLFQGEPAQCNSLPSGGDALHQGCRSRKQNDSWAVQCTHIERLSTFPLRADAVQQLSICWRCITPRLSVHKTKMANG
jgi:hypothetical protein